jgi:lipopolysaccharide transport system permease protein
MSATVQTRVAALPKFEWLTGYTELLRTMLRRELRAKYKGSTLGILWSYLYPLAMMGVYTLVFSVLWRAVHIPHYPLFVLVGLAVWTFFQAAVQLGASSILANADLIRNVSFPRELIPLAVVLSQAVASAVMVAVIVPISLIVDAGTAKTMLLSLPMFAALFCLALGVTWLASTATVFFRDVEHLLGVLFLPWFFLTPVLYSLDNLPGASEHGWLIDLLRYGNPVTPYVEGIRGTIVQGDIPGPFLFAYILIVGPLLAYIGLNVIQRFEDRFALQL